MGLLLKRGQTHRFVLDFQGAAPTGTPTIEIKQGGAGVLTEVVMIEQAGTSQKKWYKDYTIANDAALETHNVYFKAVVNAVTRYDSEVYDVTAYDNDALAVAINAIGIGTGAYEITIRTIDQSTDRVADAVVTVHNAVNDDALINKGATNSEGEITFNLAGETTYYIRVKKNGFAFTSQTVAVELESTTFTLAGTVMTYSEPAEEDLCRLFLYPVTLDGADITDLTINIFSADDFAKTAGGFFISNVQLPFIYNAATTPDSYYFDAIQGSVVKISSDDLGMAATITVPATANANLDTLIISD